MSRYQIDCAVMCPAVCGLIGLIVGFAHRVFAIPPHLTPVLRDVWPWWPQELALSGCLVGVCVGAVIALVLIGADIRQIAFIRTARRRR